MTIVSLDYRLAPEHPAPAALEDCVAGIRWAVANAAEVGADATKWAIGGDSAGGNLTAASCVYLRDHGGPLPTFQHLIYGAFDADYTKPSFLQNGEGYVLDMDTIRWFLRMYLPDESLLTDPAISPSFAPAAGLPPALMQVGTLDPLLDDTFRYGSKLALAGVPVEVKAYPDMPHGFLQMSPLLDTAKRAVADACAALYKALH